MRFVNFLTKGAFRKFDRSLGQLQEIRDSYRQLNIEIYGEQLASLLNDW